MMNFKWYAALAYIRANRLNYNVIEGPNDRFGIITSGKAFNDTRQALHDLGLDDDTCRALGIRLHKVNVVWPLEAQVARISNRHLGFAYTRIPEDKQVPLWNLLGGYADILEMWRD